MHTIVIIRQDSKVWRTEFSGDLAEVSVCRLYREHLESKHMLAAFWFESGVIRASQGVPE